MKGLSLIRPWPICITELNKRWENRHQRVVKNLGEDVALHAGLRWDGGLSAHRLARLGVGPLGGEPMPLEELVKTLHRGMAQSGIVAVVRIIGCVSYDLETQELAAEPNYDLHEQRSTWGVPGRWGWLLDDVRVLETPVPAKGKQGLWNLSASQEEMVQERLSALG